MLVQKSLTPARKRLIIIGVVIAMIGLGYVGYDNLLKDKLAIKPGPVNTNTKAQPVSVPKFNSELFKDPKIFDLQQHGEPGFAQQYEVAPTDANTPYPVKNVRAADPGLGGIIYLWWDLPDKVNFNKVVIYRSSILGDPGEQIAVISNTAAEKTFKDANLENNVTYYYLVKTRNNSDIESQNESQVLAVATDSFPPAPPIDITVEDKGDGKNILIRWTNPKDLDFSYTRIYRSTAEGQIGYLIDQIIGETGQNKEKIDDQTSPGIIYHYTLTSVDKNGNESSKKMVGPTGRLNPFAPLTF